MGNDANFDPTIRTTPQTSPFGETGGREQPLPSKTADSVVQTTHNIATQTGLVPEGENKLDIYIPQEQMAASSSSDGSLDTQQTVGRYRQEPGKLKDLDAKITKTEKHVANLREQAAQTKSGKKGKAKKSSLHEQIEVHQNRLEGLIKERDQEIARIDSSVRSLWKPELVDFLPQSAQDHQQFVKERREDIADAKGQFINQRGGLQGRKEKQTALEAKIAKTERHISRLQTAAASRGKAKKGKARKASDQEQIKQAQNRLTGLKKERDSLISDLEQRVQTLMREGSIEKIPDGKSGVYFLCDTKGVRRFVIKPNDEEMFTLNNPKSFAAPFRADHDIVDPKPGVSVYSGAQNEAMTSTLAQHLGISNCTVKSELIVLSSDSFHDFTDTLTEDRTEVKELYGYPDREKLCVVQEYIPDTSDIGLLLLSGSGKTQADYMKMEQEESDKLEREILPKDINQSMFERAIILSLVCGETDGNAGNLLLANRANSGTKRRDIYKIDNAATFPSSNDAITSGADWVLNASERPLSDSARKLIRRLDANSIARLMRQNGYGEDAVNSMIERVEWLKIYEEEEKDITVIDFVEIFEKYI